MRRNLSEFRTKIAEYEKNYESNFEYIKKEYLDEDGNAVININLSGMEIYNPLTVGHQRELIPEIYSTIDSKVYPIPAEIPIILNFYGVQREDRSQVEALVKEHYGLVFKDKKIDLHINRVKYISMFVIGGLLLALYFMLSNSPINELWYEFLSIIATFIVWEGADFAILERRSLKIAYYDAAQTVLAKFRFSDKTT